jgi:hypothetical protein
VSGDDGLGGTASLDFDTAYALNAVIEYQLGDVFAVGVMPRYVFGVIASGASGDSDTALDLRVRVSAGTNVAPRARVYGFGAVGYSIIYPPSTAMSANATGLTVTGGAGASYAVNPRMRAFAEIGYEYGFQSVSENGSSSDFNVKYLEIGVGLQAALGGS